MVPLGILSGVTRRWEISRAGLGLGHEPRRQLTLWSEASAKMPVLPLPLNVLGSHTVLSREYDTPHTLVPQMSTKEVRGHRGSPEGYMQGTRELGGARDSTAHAGPTRATGIATGREPAHCSPPGRPKTPEEGRGQNPLLCLHPLAPCGGHSS